MKTSNADDERFEFYTCFSGSYRPTGRGGPDLKIVPPPVGYAPGSSNFLPTRLSNAFAQNRNRVHLPEEAGERENLHWKKKKKRHARRRRNRGGRRAIRVRGSSVADAGTTKSRRGVPAGVEAGGPGRARVDCLRTGLSSRPRPRPSKVADAGRTDDVLRSHDVRRSRGGTAASARHLVSAYRTRV